MNPMRFCFIVLALLACASPARAGRLEDGIAALSSGNLQDAMIYLQPLATKGDVHAQVAIGIMAEKKMGDFAGAVKWYTKAGDQGDPVAAWLAGMLYDNGKYCGHPPYNMGSALKADMNEAAKWVRKAADGGFPAAQANLGRMYVEGYGDLKPDKAEADFWYSLAIASNAYADLSLYGFFPGMVDVAHLKELAKVSRVDVEAALSPAQLADVQKRVKEWKPTAPGAPAAQH
ncbi:MAG: tetratricopeptide repeat protein [Alphaproteobacteria bacterium]